METTNVEVLKAFLQWLKESDTVSTIYVKKNKGTGTYKDCKIITFTPGELKGKPFCHLLIETKNGRFAFPVEDIKKVKFLIIYPDKKVRQDFTLEVLEKK